MRKESEGMEIVFGCANTYLSNTLTGKIAVTLCKNQKYCRYLIELTKKLRFLRLVYPSAILNHLSFSSGFSITMQIYHKAVSQFNDINHPTFLKITFDEIEKFKLYCYKGF